MSADPPTLEQRREIFVNTQRFFIEQLIQAIDNEDTESVATVSETALSFLPPVNSGRLFWTAFLDIANLLLYEESWSTDEVQAALDSLLPCLLTIDHRFTPAVQWQVKLSDKLKERYARTGILDDHDFHLSWLEWRLQTLPEDHIHRIVWSCRITSGFMERHSRTLSSHDIAKALAHSENLANPAYSEHPDFPLALVQKYGLLVAVGGEADEMQEAYEQAQAATSNLPVDSRVNDLLWDNRLQWLEHQYESTGQAEYLEMAIALAEHGASVFSTHASTYARWLSNIASNISRRFVKRRDMRDLQRTVELLQQSVELTEENDQSRALRLNNLVAALQQRYDRTGNVDDLGLAVSYSNKAVKATHRLEPAKASSWLRQMARVLMTRYEQTGNTEDMNLSIRKVNEALSISPQSDDDIQDCRALLATLHSLKFSRTRDPQDMDDALATYSQIFSSKALGNHVKSDILHDDAVFLMQVYERTGDLGALDMATTMIRLVLESQTPEHVKFGNTNFTFALLLISRYRDTDDVDALEHAMQHCRIALQTTEQDLPRRTQQLYVAAMTLGMRFNRFQDPRDLDECVELLKKAQRLPSAPFHRIHAGRRATWLLSGMMRKFDEADSVVEETLKLLPSLCSRNLNREDQQHALESCEGIVSFACSLSLYKGDVYEALQRAEFGRGMMLGYIINGRSSDLSELRQHYADLANEYESLQDTISTKVDGLPPAAQENVTLDRQEAANKLIEVEEKIRQLPGFEFFNQHSPVTELQECAEDGHIILVNINDIRADAIIVSRDNIKSVALSLDDLKSPDAPRAFRNLFLEYSSPESQHLLDSYIRHQPSQLDSSGSDNTPLPRMRQKNHTFPDERGSRNVMLEQSDTSDAMEWLWTTCVEPVLNQLPPSEDLPRVWWIGSGYASSLPFHAAGRYVNGIFKGCLDRTLSSYTTTIKALKHTRDKSAIAKAQVGERQSLLLVTMPTTPGHTPLFGVEDEGREIRDGIDNRMDVISLRQPSADQVLEKIGHCNIAHFACHGVSDERDPSKSHILLQQKSQSGELRDGVDKLRVSELLDVVNKDRAWIAYLSACSTAESKSISLGDEGIHLSSAFQMAGFPHVVGSLWPVRDKACAKLSGLFYRNLLKRDGSENANRSVAEALRCAILELRQDPQVDIHTWAPYVHFGP